MSEPTSILILHNAPGTGDASDCAESVAGVLDEVHAVAHACSVLGISCRTHAVARLEDVPRALDVAPEDVVFNLVEGFPSGVEDANAVPDLCRAFAKGCTGNSSRCLSRALDKGLTKTLLRGAGVPTPAGVVVDVGCAPDTACLPAPPYIVKPVAADASEGIRAATNIVPCAGDALLRAVTSVHESFKQAALVETLVGVRELNVSVTEQESGPVVLPIAEIDFSAFPSGKPRVVDYDAKWRPDTFEHNHTPRKIPAPLPVSVAEHVRELALRCWHVLGCSDYARVDFRLGEHDELFVLEVNPNPDISPDAGFAAALDAAGITFPAFVARVTANARGRMANAGAGCAFAAQVPPRDGIHPTTPGTRDAILELLRQTTFFAANELDIAREVLDEALAQGTDGHYQSFAAYVDGLPVGWVCYGPTPCTAHTFDIYWLAVSPAHQEQGIGRNLMQFAEDAIAERGGRLAVVETAGRAQYDPTRAFYRRRGYEEVARVTDFYAPGDPKVIYTKPLGISVPSSTA